MKRWFITILVLLLLTMSAGCGKEQKASENHSVLEEQSGEEKNLDVVQITEKMLTEQVNDFYLNAEDYLGKTITYEGIFDITTGPYTNKEYYYVIRYGPGCCGDDGYIGFEVQWDKEYPKQDDWVEVTGVLDAYEEDGYKYLYLKVTSIQVLEERGLEFIS